jgi:hypothetical protein
LFWLFGLFRGYGRWGGQGKFWFCGFAVVVVGGRRRGVAVDAAQLLGVSLGDAPGAVPGMVAAELLSGGRIIPPSGRVAHGSQFGPAEQSELRHASIVPESGSNGRPTQ